MLVMYRRVSLPPPYDKVVVGPLIGALVGRPLVVGSGVLDGTTFRVGVKVKDGVRVGARVGVRLGAGVAVLLGRGVALAGREVGPVFGVGLAS